MSVGESHLKRPKKNYLSRFTNYVGVIANRQHRDTHTLPMYALTFILTYNISRYKFKFLLR